MLRHVLSRLAPALSDSVGGCHSPDEGESFVRAIGVAALAVLVLASACSSADPQRATPAVDAASSADLRARAFMRACDDLRCAGGPIIGSDTIPDGVREAIARLTDEVDYLGPAEVEQRFSSTGGVFDGGVTLIGVEEVSETERDDVRGVDTWTSRGPGDFFGRTYLFRWDGDMWVDTSPDAVDVTVTSAVS